MAQHKESACNSGDTGDAGLIPVSERSPGEGNDNPLQYSCLKSARDREAWRAIVQRVSKSQTQLSTQFLFQDILALGRLPLKNQFVKVWNGQELDNYLANVTVGSFIWSSCISCSRILLQLSTSLFLVKYCPYVCELETCGCDCLRAEQSEVSSAGQPQRQPFQRAMLPVCALGQIWRTSK